MLRSLSLSSLTTRFRPVLARLAADDFILPHWSSLEAAPNGNGKGTAPEGALSPWKADTAPRDIVAAGQTATPLGALLSPSQVRTFLDCSARWWYKYGLGLPDPPGASLVRGKALHRVAEAYFRARIAGASPEPEDLAEVFEVSWEECCSDAVFREDDDVEELKKQTAILARKYLDEVAREIKPAAVETPVSGKIGGVPVRGIVDLIDEEGRIIDLKTAGRKPSGVSPDYRLQLASYRLLAPGASGKVRLDTIVATKAPQVVTLAFDIEEKDVRMAEILYPHVREGIREGLFFPNRGSNLCSRRNCPFADACEGDFGGRVE